MRRFLTFLSRPAAMVAAAFLVILALPLAIAAREAIRPLPSAQVTMAALPAPPVAPVPPVPPAPAATTPMPPAPPVASVPAVPPVPPVPAVPKHSLFGNGFCFLSLDDDVNVRGNSITVHRNGRKYEITDPATVRAVHAAVDARMADVRKEVERAMAEAMGARQEAMKEMEHARAEAMRARDEALREAEHAREIAMADRQTALRAAEVAREAARVDRERIRLEVEEARHAAEAARESIREQGPDELDVQIDRIIDDAIARGLAKEK